LITARNYSREREIIMAKNLKDLTEAKEQIEEELAKIAKEIALQEDLIRRESRFEELQEEFLEYMELVEVHRKAHRVGLWDHPYDVANAMIGTLGNTPLTRQLGALEHLLAELSVLLT
jgi:hypothetical protein